MKIIKNKKIGKDGKMKNGLISVCVATWLILVLVITLLITQSFIYKSVLASQYSLQRIVWILERMEKR